MLHIAFPVYLVNFVKFVLTRKCQRAVTGLGLVLTYSNPIMTKGKTFSRSLRCAFRDCEIFQKFVHRRISVLTFCNSVVKHTLSVQEYGIRFPGRSNRHSVANGSLPLATFLRCCVAQTLSRGDRPRYLLHAAA